MLMVKLSDYNARAVGIAWFRKEDYSTLLAIFEDGDQFARTWEEWEKGAKEAEQKFKADGYIVERVYIDPDTFADWCRQEGVRVAREGRSRFAGSVVAKKYGRNQS
jgi:hypothetical protein